jgi:hypothetical protein
VTRSMRMRVGIVVGLAGLATTSSVAALPAAQASVPTIAFAAATYIPTGQSYDTSSLDENGTATGDFLNNGHSDVVCVCQWEGSSITIMYGNGDGSFATPGTSISVGSEDENVVTGQFTSSGRTDIAVLGATGFTLLVNDGGGHFHAGTMYRLEQAPFQDSAVAGDFNHDGDLDLAIKTPTGIQTEFGNGDGTFRTGPFSAIPDSFTPAITSIATANLNGDANIDLLAADAASQQIFALDGNGTGGFTETGAGAAPFVPGSVVAADVNDSGLDSAVALDEFNAPGTSAALLINNGHGGFGAAKTYNGGYNVASATVGDFNHDGNPDVVSDDTTGGNQVILASDGSGDLTQAGSFATGINSQTPVVADFNGDGKPDIAVTTTCPGLGFFYNEGCLAVLLNTSP